MEADGVESYAESGERERETDSVGVQQSDRQTLMLVERSDAETSMDE